MKNPNFPLGLLVNFTHKFLNVGQGLFMSGKIVIAGKNGKRVFSWVYDCGSTSQTKIDSAVSQEFSNTDEIDFVFISHFDKDHINGLISLLKNVKKIKNLVLPYYPLWKRILIGIECEKNGKNLNYTFLVNPVQFLTTHGKIDQFVFVDDSYKPRDISKLISTSETDSQKNPYSFEFEFELEELSEEFKSSTLTRVRKLKSGSNIVLPNIWEFIPYQDKEIRFEFFKRFQKSVKKQESILLNEKDGKKLQSCIKKLKDIYIKKFGATSEKKNLISMYLLGRILTEEPLWADHYCFNRKYLTEWQKVFLRLRFFGEYSPNILLTGDGFLKTKEQLNNIKNHFSPISLTNICIFQVMHHGSKNNFQNGISNYIIPDFAVFSSDPKIRPFHPNIKVLKHYSYCYRVPVNSTSNCIFEYYYRL